ncbi:VPLPA-CTERM sorting domain-containing protein [uncultured Roseibium sp.]|uniref:VPLPA-CTERM sorting domain-containing protein n=1 Tax=uncultured Roseibium sp. TaxID=1936171 RepID=UPI002623BB38|nr:VPLPA-CTERM sorting domain-containing protein [uncultured Roseibium sp.]
MHDQVFVDGPQGNFDSSPELTSGCSLALFCFVITPFEIAPGGPGISFVSLVRNRDDTSISITDGIARTEWLSALSTSGDDRVVYATWEATVIPVPAAAWLLITAFDGMAAFQRFSRSKYLH